MLGGAELGLSPPSSPRSSCGRLCAELHAPTPMAACPSLPTGLGWALGWVGQVGRCLSGAPSREGNRILYMLRQIRHLKWKNPTQIKDSWAHPRPRPPPLGSPRRLRNPRGLWGSGSGERGCGSQGGSFWKPRMCEISPSCAPWREGLNGVINHFPEWSRTPCEAASGGLGWAEDSLGRRGAWGRGPHLDCLRHTCRVGHLATQHRFMSTHDA